MWVFPSTQTSQLTNSKINHNKYYRFINIINLCFFSSCNNSKKSICKILSLTVDFIIQNICQKHFLCFSHTKKKFLVSFWFIDSVLI